MPSTSAATRRHTGTQFVEAMVFLRGQFADDSLGVGLHDRLVPVLTAQRKNGATAARRLRCSGPSSWNSVSVFVEPTDSPRRLPIGARPGCAEFARGGKRLYTLAILAGVMVSVEGGRLGHRQSYRLGQAGPRSS